MAHPGTKNGGDTGSKILIAVDFGTTYSAVAWANTDEPDSQNLMTEWAKGLSGDKTPTILQYADDRIKWGLELDDLAPDEKINEWFKLGLCPDVEDKRPANATLLRAYPSKTALPQVRGNKCTKMVVDYLKKLWEAVERELKTFDQMYELPREYIITVPAMWTEEAQDATRACAAEAFLNSRYRIDEIQIVAEPEAAGIYALYAMPKLGLKKGDTFVICDAGGGTVDLSSYKVNKSAQYIDLERVSILSGDLCGSSLLNRIFEAYLENKIGTEFEELEERQQAWFKSVVNNFEKNIKPRFTGDEETRDSYIINAFDFNDNIKRGIRNSKLYIPVGEIRTEVFDKVISRIKELVREQVDATGNVKEILLAGGFGENAYLKSQIEEEVGEKIKVRPIQNSRTAIVKGALIAGLTEAGRLEKRRRPERQPEEEDYPGQREHKDYGRIYARVIIRPAPKHYGVFVMDEFNPANETHRKGRERKVPGFNGGPDMIERIDWFVKKEETIPDGENKPFLLSYEREASPGGTRPKTLHCRVFSSDAKDPPLFPDLPKFPCRPPAKHLLTLEIDLDEITDWKPTLKGDNRYYWCVDFEVHMSLHSAKLSFFLSRGDKRYKPKHVTYHSQRP